MKKICLLILTLVLLIPQLSGCTQSDELVIQLCTSPDSIPSAFSEDDCYTDWNKAPYKKSDAKQEVTVTCGDITVSGHYLRSEIRQPEYFEAHWYATSNGQIFAIDNKGRLLRYTSPSSPFVENDGKVYTEAQCLEIARAFVDEFVDVDEYTVTSIYNSSLNWYVIHFKKYIGDLLTGDYIGVIVHERTGSFDFDSYMFGMIPSDMKVDFDFEEIEARLVEKFEQMYGEEMGEYDELTHGEFRYELTCDKKKRAVLICTVGVTIECYDENGNYTGRYGDELTFRIQ